MRAQARLLLIGLLLTGIAASAAAQTIAERFPENTLLYIQWPGSDAMMAAAKDTSYARLLAEPEMETCRAKVATALTAFINAQVESEGIDPEVSKGITALAGTLWHKPMAIGLIGVVPQGMSVDAAIVVRAGPDAPAMLEHVEKLLAAAELPMQHVIEQELGSITWKELSVLGPTLPLRWAVVGEDLIFSIGPRTAQHLGSAQPGKHLAGSERFVQAMKLTGGNSASSTLYIDIPAVLDCLESFQPMFAENEVPVLGTPNGVRELLASVGMGSARSFSVVSGAHDDHFRTTYLLHAPGLKKAGEDAGWASRPLTDDDLRVVPRGVSWASITNFHLSALYQSVWSLVRSLAGEEAQGITQAVAGFEERIGMKVGDDLVGAFDDTWAFFDAPSHGGFWITGITLAVEVKPGNRLDEGLRAIVRLIAEESGAGEALTVREETFRGCKISYVNVDGFPLPLAPAWAEYQGRWIFALYPQMVRTTLTHIMDKAPSILDNPDFQRGRKRIPPDACAIDYIDTVAGMRQMYSLALPIGQALQAMGRGEGLELDPGVLPSFATIEKHLYGSVNGQVVTDDGAMGVSTGPLPLSIPFLDEGGAGGGVVAAAMVTSITLPSLARARTLSKRAVSAANLKGIGTAMYTYGNENEDKFPPGFQILIQSNMISPKTLISPLEVNDEAVCSYIYLKGQSADGDPRNVVAYEKPVNYDGEGTNVLFGDSHVEFMTMEGFEEVLAKTAERLGRPLEVQGMSADEEIDGEGQPVTGEQESTEAPTENRPTESIEPTPEPSTPQEQPQTGAPADGNRRTIARNMVGAGGPLATQLELFRTHMERYPRELIELVEKPDNEDEASLWKGPYVRSFDTLIDPWGHELQYRSPGEHSPKYDLWSAGPDGESTTADDIGSWMK